MALRIIVVHDSNIIRREIRDLLNSSPEEWLSCGEIEVSEQMSDRVETRRHSARSFRRSAFWASYRQSFAGISSLDTVVLISEQEPSVLQHLAASLAVQHTIPKSRLVTD
jgi:hypothetical protein